MNIRFLAAIGMMAFAFVSCGDKARVTGTTELPLNGTWKLVYSKMIKNGDTLNTYPVQGQEMIKMFNGSHFAFFKHDLLKGSDSSAIYESGAGTYELSGNKYAEHLQYCNYRDWEDRHFSFTLALSGDTLVQRGIEKIDSLNVDHEIVEAYIRVR